MARSDAPLRYAIRGGIEGKKRLDLLARVMLPTTMQLFDRVGLIRGMKCLDVGCGGGHVAMLIAGIVGPEGRVVGTDTDAEILAFAKRRCRSGEAHQRYISTAGCLRVLVARRIRYRLRPFSALALERAGEVSRSHGRGVRAGRNYCHRGH